MVEGQTNKHHPTLWGRGKAPWKQETPLQAALFSLCEKKEKGVEDDENCKLFWNSTPLQADNSLHQTEAFPSHLASILEPKPAFQQETHRGTAAPALLSPSVPRRARRHHRCPLPCPFSTARRRGRRRAGEPRYLQAEDVLALPQGHGLPQDAGAVGRGRRNAALLTRAATR